MYGGELIKSREPEHSDISRYLPAPPSRYPPRSVTSSISVSLAFIRPSSPIHLRTSRFSSLASRLCFFAPASSTARKKINTRRTRRHKASPRRGNYVGPRIMRPRSDRVRSRALRASAPNNKGANGERWQVENTRKPWETRIPPFPRHSANNSLDDTSSGILSFWNLGRWSGFVRRSILLRRWMWFKAKPGWKPGFLRGNAGTNNATNKTAITRELYKVYRTLVRFAFMIVLAPHKTVLYMPLRVITNCRATTKGFNVWLSTVAHFLGERESSHLVLFNRFEHRIHSAIATMLRAITATGETGSRLLATRNYVNGILSNESKISDYIQRDFSEEFKFDGSGCVVN